MKTQGLEALTDIFVVREAVPLEARLLKEELAIKRAGDFSLGRHGGG